MTVHTSGFRSAALATGLALCATMGAAQDRAANISAMLAQLPATFALPAENLREITFFDVEAGVAGIGFGALGLSPAELLARSVPGQFSYALFLGIEEAWPELIGFAPLDMRHGITVRHDNSVSVVLQLVEGAGKGVPTVLLANGYVAAERETGTAYWRLEDDFAISLEDRNALDPFGGELGMASRIGLLGDRLVQARGWDDFDALFSSPVPNLAGVPSVAAILEAIDAPVFENLAVVRAYLLTDSTRMVDSFGALSGALLEDTEQRDALIEELASRGERVPLPLWTTALFADMANAREEAAVLLIAFASPESAAEAQEAIAAAWVSYQSLIARTTFAEIFGAVPEFDIIGDSPAVLAIIIRGGPPPGDVRPGMQNRPYNLFLNALFARDMPFLSPF